MTYILIIILTTKSKLLKSILYPAADPEFFFKKMLKEKEKGLTARPMK